MSITTFWESLKIKKYCRECGSLLPVIRSNNLIVYCSMKCRKLSISKYRKNMIKEERISKGAKVLKELIKRSVFPAYQKWLLTFIDLVEDHMKNCKSGEKEFDITYEEAKKTFSGLTQEEGEVPVS